LFSFVLPAFVRRRLMRRTRDLLATRRGRECSDEFMELLLRGMDVAFCLFWGYRRNIRGFSGKYVFVTQDQSIDEGVGVSAIFEDGDMRVEGEADDDPDVTIVFRNSRALWAYIFSENQDIIDSVLKNDIELHGNLNYVYRFGFLARELAHTLGMA
ncbi:MAG: hypothetical protein ACYS9X_23930, partial [Planctomycetota bacterium]